MKRRFSPRALRGLRKPVTWIRTLFVESSLNLNGGTGSLTEFVLLDPDDVLVATSRLNNTVSIRRIVVNGGVAMSLATTGLAQDICQLMWAVYILDQDDADANINTTSPTAIMGSERILRCGCEMFTGQSGTAAGMIGGNIYPGIKVDIDIRVNAKIRRDQELYLGMQFGSGISPPVTLASFGAYSSVLCNVP